MFYLVKPPLFIRKLLSDRMWEMPVGEKKIYLSFDDGPHPQATPFVLDQLKKYGAKASFFCVGKNVEAFPEIYDRIQREGHSVGNHTYSHLDARRVSEKEYLEDVGRAAEVVRTQMFRPPYGRISRFLVKALKGKRYDYTTVLWNVLSGDFDNRLTGDQCLHNVLLNAGDGSIVVFHDSEKSMSKLEIALPVVLRYFTTKGYQFEKLSVKKEG